MPAQAIPHKPRKIGTADLHGRHVHRNRNRPQTARFPCCDLTANLFKYPGADWNHQPIRFRHRDEAHGWNLAMFRVIHPDQGFEAGQLPVRPDFGLVVHYEVAFAQGDPQLLIHSHPVENLVARGKYLGMIAAQIFGAIHCRIGRPLQLLGIRAVVGKDGNTHTRPGIQLMSVYNEGLPDRIENTVRDFSRLAHVFHFVQHDRELIPADPGHGIGRPESAFHAPGDFTQEQVTHAMAEGVVHLFESIEIDKQHCETLAECIRLPHGTFETLFEKRAVRKARKAVVMGLELKTVVKVALLDRQTRNSSGGLRDPRIGFLRLRSLPVEQENCARLPLHVENRP